MTSAPAAWELEAFNWVMAKDSAERSLHSFVRQGWSQVEPQRTFMDNWHIVAVCEHLEAVTDGRIKRLLFNVPPGTSKSLLVCVFWPAWVWTTRPHKRFMFSTYADALSTRDSVRCRNLIQSQWYQARWPMLFSEDVNTKGLYKNQATGWRLASSVGGKGTGEHPDYNVFDDPHNTDPKSVESDVERQAVLDWWDGKMTTRGAIVDCAQVGVMQRVHPLDLSDHVQRKGTWEVICLPMRFESYENAVRDGKTVRVPRMKPTSLGWTDPRTVDGELLWPEAYPDAKIKDLEIDMGEHHALAQLQQRPSARGGGMFQREWFSRILQAAPPLYRLVRYWDKAGTAGGGGAQTSGVLMGLTLEIAVATGGARRRGHVVVLHCESGRWRSADREDVIRATAALDRQRWGNAVETWVEQEPGSGGKESAENTVVNMAGFICNAERVTGPKEVRAEPFASQCKVGNVSLLAGDWTAAFIAELCVFPGGRLRDKGDAAGGAYNKLNAADGVLRGSDDLTTKPREHEGERLIPARIRPEEFAL